MDNLFAKRFSELLKTCPYSYEELAKKLGLKSKGTISKYANGDIKNVNMSMIVKISEVFQVSPIWLIGLTDDPHYIIADNSDVIKVPIVQSIKWNKRIEKQIDPNNYLLLSKKFIKSHIYFGYQMNDDSMNPFIMKDDMLLIQQQEDPQNGQTVFAITSDNQVIIRTILKTETGIILKPMNSKYDPIVFTQKDIKENKINIIGLVKKSERLKYFG